MASPTPTEDLLDLKMLPAWANEPASRNDYADFEGEEADAAGGRRPDRPRSRDRERRGPRQPDRRRERQQRDGGSRPSQEARRERGPRREPRPEISAEPLLVNVRFLPHQRAFENVIAQIKSAPVAYSVFALARLFLEKPERYDVRLTMPEGTQLFQLGEGGLVASDRRILESSAFTSARDDFYTVEVVQ